MNYFGICLVGLVTGISGLLAVSFPQHKGQSNTLRAFTGSFLFSIILSHLLPELFLQSAHHISIPLFLLIGFFAQFLLDMFGSSIAHGHIMSTSVPTRHYSYQLLLVLCLHAFIEGIALPEAPLGIWWGVMLHKIPTAFALGRLFKQHKGWCLASLSLFALAAPSGFFLYEYLNDSDFLNNEYLLGIRALGIGTLLHIATIMVLESSPHHRLEKKKVGAMLLGIILALSTSQHDHSHTVHPMNLQHSGCN